MIYWLSILLCMFWLKQICSRFSDVLELGQMECLKQNKIKNSVINTLIVLYTKIIAFYRNFWFVRSGELENLWIIKLIDLLASQIHTHTRARTRMILRVYFLWYQTVLFPNRKWFLVKNVCLLQFCAFSLLLLKIVFFVVVAAADMEYSIYIHDCVHMQKKVAWEKNQNN